MKFTPQLILSLSLAVAAVFFFHGAESAMLTITNNCSFTVWPGTLTGSGPALSTTGFELSSKSSSTIEAPPSWSGRVWARTGCNAANNTFKCVTGDCGSNQVQCNGAGGSPPVSLAEFTIAPSKTGKDFFDISLVDGFDLPMSITPTNGDAGCNPVSCPGDVNAVCPPELQVKGPDGAAVVGCKSACLAFNKPEYCCTGEYSTPDKCPPSNYSMIFKNQCPQAYAYAYDDKTALASCSGGASYTITFCP